MTLGRYLNFEQFHSYPPFNSVLLTDGRCPICPWCAFLREAVCTAQEISVLDSDCELQIQWPNYWNFLSGSGLPFFSLCVCRCLLSWWQVCLFAKPWCRIKAVTKLKLHRSKSLSGCTQQVHSRSACLESTTWIGNMKLEFPYSVLDYLLWATYTAILQKSDGFSLLIPFSFLPCLPNVYDWKM